MVANDASLRGKSKALAQRYGLMAQEVTQMYLFERFLARLSASPYKDRFVVKGGILVSSLVGIANRTTMDLDATIRSLRFDESTVRTVVSEICAFDLRDGVSFELERVVPIRDDDEYGGYRAQLKALFGRMAAPMKVDLTTGDVVTPGPIVRSLPMLFEPGAVEVLAYTTETCLSEKFESIVKRGVTTSRARDLYDVAMLVRIYGEGLDWSVLAEAVRATAQHRGTLELVRDYERTCDEMASSEAIRHMWGNYVRRNHYAEAVSLDAAICATRMIGRRCLAQEM